MKLLIPVSAALIILSAFCYTTSAPKPALLTCTLAADKSTYKIGELPRLKVDIINTSKKDMYLIGSLDGSAVKWRMPHCYFTIQKPVSDSTRLARCRNMNPLTPGNFILVKAGERFNPYQAIDEYGFFTDHRATDTATFRNPGVYKIRFYYSTNSTNIRDFMGDLPSQQDKTKNQQLHTLFEKVPKVDIVSNEIEIIFEQ
jgi:hypothetical protein